MFRAKLGSVGSVWWCWQFLPRTGLERQLPESSLARSRDGHSCVHSLPEHHKVWKVSLEFESSLPQLLPWKTLLPNLVGYYPINLKWEFSKLGFSSFFPVWKMGCTGTNSYYSLTFYQRGASLWVARFVVTEFKSSLSLTLSFNADPWTRSK